MYLKPTTRYQPRKSKDKLITATETVTGPVESISNFVHAEENEDPNTLIDIKVSNPLKKIYHLIDDIKKHQSTTFSLKFTIPLIALPLFLFAAFQIGRGEAICRQNTVSKTGLLINIAVDVPYNKLDEIPFIGSLLKIFSWSESNSQYITENRSLLVELSGNTITLLHPDKIKLDKYDNMNVIATGLYSSCTNVMTIVSENNVELL